MAELCDTGLPVARRGYRHSAAGFLRDTLLASPWTDPENGSLVAVEDDAVVGFLALHGRRVRFGDRSLRAVCCSHLVVDADHRGGAAGALLLGRCLQGPQDLTLSDTAMEVVARVWTTFGGAVDTMRSLDWMYVLRPGRLAARLARRWVGGARPDRSELPVPSVPVHLANRFLPRLHAEADPAVRRAPLTAATAIAESQPVTKGLRLHAEYEETYLSWLFERLRGLPGDFVAQMVCRGGRPIGWYVYRLTPDGMARVLQVMAGPRHAEAVVDDLLADARARGATLATGRLEPHLYEPLRRRRSAVGFGERHVVHSHDAAVLAVYATSAAVVSRLDGEWW